MFTPLGINNYNTRHLLWLAMHILILHCCAEQPHGVGDAGSLSQLLIARSVINYGDTSMFQRVYEKLDSGQCLHILVIGGSVTSYNITGAWHQVFIQLLNVRYPCFRVSSSRRNLLKERGLHTSTVIALGGRPSGYWNDLFSGNQEALLYGADLVLVDNVNDSQYVMAKQNEAQKSKDGYAIDPEDGRAHTEVLLGLLLQRARRNTSSSSTDGQQQTCGEGTRAWTGAAVVLIGTTYPRSSLRTLDGLPPTERTWKTVAMELPVVQYHGVPLVAPLQGIAPLRRAMRKWMAENWFRDDIHPTLLGHEVVGTVAADFVTMVLQHLGSPPPWAEVAPQESQYYCPRAVKFSNQQRLDMYLDGQGLELLLSEPNPQKWADVLATRNASLCSDWQVEADKPLKIGLISQKAGSHCDLFVTPAEMRRFRSINVLHLHVYRSYEHMGVLEVSLSAAPARPDGSCPAISDGGNLAGRVQLGSIRIDCLHESMFTTPAKVELPFTLDALQPPAAAGTPNTVADLGHCLYVSLSVPETKRAENKVKVVMMKLHGT